MDKKDMKKLLASLSIASLIAGAGFSLTGCATTA
jgi:radical SAM modification target selenobiotic family peptide